MFTIKDLPFGKDQLKGISAKTNEIHHDKLYAGYVNKRNEIEDALASTDKSKAAATYSVFRGLKVEETFNADGAILHELYFDSLGGDGVATGAFVEKATADFGSWQAFIDDLTATAMACRGWAVTAYDPSDNKIHNFLCDSHNQGGVWGTIPLFTIDCYEHAYFIDFGSDRKSYIASFMQNVNWSAVEKRWLAAQK